MRCKLESGFCCPCAYGHIAEYQHSSSKPLWTDPKHAAQTRRSISTGGQSPLLPHLQHYPKSHCPTKSGKQQACALRTSARNRCVRPIIHYPAADRSYICAGHITFYRLVRNHVLPPEFKPRSGLGTCTESPVPPHLQQYQHCQWPIDAPSRQVDGIRKYGRIWKLEFSLSHCPSTLVAAPTFINRQNHPPV